MNSYFPVRRIPNDKFTIVVAFDHNQVIGIKNRLPWKIPEDMEHFRKFTSNKNVVMGRKTFESIGKPLPGRRNVVVSRNPDLKIEGAEVVSSLQEALVLLGTEKENCLIGGGTLYQEALDLDLVNQIMATEVYGMHAGDTFFPKIDPLVWDLIYGKNITSAPCEFSLYRHKRFAVEERYFHD